MFLDLSGAFGMLNQRGWEHYFILARIILHVLFQFCIPAPRQFRTAGNAGSHRSTCAKQKTAAIVVMGF